MTEYGYSVILLTSNVGDLYWAYQTSILDFTIFRFILILIDSLHDVCVSGLMTPMTRYTSIRQFQST